MFSVCSWRCQQTQIGELIWEVCSTSEELLMQTLDPPQCPFRFLGWPRKIHQMTGDQNVMACKSQWVIWCIVVMRTSMPERWSEEFCISNAVLQEASGDFSRLVWYVHIFLYWWLDGQRHSAHVAIFAVDLLGGRRVMHCSSQPWKWRMHTSCCTTEVVQRW